VTSLCFSKLGFFAVGFVKLHTSAVAGYRRVLFSWMKPGWRLKLAAAAFVGESCDHERCGLCDTLFYDNQSRRESVSGNLDEGLLYHLDEDQKKAKEAVGLAGHDKDGHQYEWTLG
jgi:hypothetical protein